MLVLFLMVFLVLVLMAVMVIPAYPAITAADLVMLMGVVMVRREVGGLQVEVVLVRMVKRRGDQLCFLLVLVHVNIDCNILREVAGNEDVNIV